LLLDSVLAADSEADRKTPLPDVPERDMVRDFVDTMDFVTDEEPPPPDVPERDMVRDFVDTTDFVTDEEPPPPDVPERDMVRDFVTVDTMDFVTDEEPPPPDVPERDMVRDFVDTTDCEGDASAPRDPDLEWDEERDAERNFEMNLDLVGSAESEGLNVGVELGSGEVDGALVCVAEGVEDAPKETERAAVPEGDGRAGLWLAEALEETLGSTT
jgi:hypothetical protein